MFDKFLFRLTSYKFNLINKIVLSFGRRIRRGIRITKAKIRERKSIQSSEYHAQHVMIAQLEAYNHYIPEPFECDAVNFIANNRYRPPLEKNIGLKAYIKGAYKEVLVEGDHVSILREPFIFDIIDKFKIYLQDIQKNKE